MKKSALPEGVKENGRSLQHVSIADKNDVPLLTHAAVYRSHCFARLRMMDWGFAPNLSRDSVPAPCKGVPPLTPVQPRTIWYNPTPKSATIRQFCAVTLPPISSSMGVSNGVRQPQDKFEKFAFVPKQKSGTVAKDSPQFLRGAPGRATTR